MKTFFYLKTIFIILLCVIITRPAFGQTRGDIYPELEGREPIILIAEDSPQRRTVINIFNITTVPSFHEPNAPRFMLIDQEGKFALGIGGYVRAVASYDFDGISNNVDFIPALFPQKGSDFARNQFQLDATTSMIYLKMVAHTKSLGDIIIYTGGNFRGNGNTFKLRNAYMSMLGFTFGYDTGLFMDASACPPTIDFQGPNGMVFYRTAQARYEHNITKHLKFGVGIEAPSVNGTSLSNDVITTQRCPDIPAYMQYSWNSASHIKVAGIFRSMSYKDEVANKFKALTGWGVQASTTFSLGKFQVYGQYTYGKGIATFFNDLGELNLDLVPEYGSTGEMQVLPMMGWYAGLQYNFSKKIFASSTFSSSCLSSRNNYSKYNQASYKRGRYLVANVFWNVSPEMQVGAEYLHGCRKDFDKEKTGANRINLCTRFNF